MQKLKYKHVKKLIEMKANDADIKILLNMSQYQDERGYVTGVYYRDYSIQNFKKNSAEKSIEVKSNQTYYRALKRLEENGIIKIEKNHYGDRDIKILDNDFSQIDWTEKENFAEGGYISTKRKIFQKSEFYKMKPNEKLLTMFLMEKTRISKGTFSKKKDDFLTEIEELFDVNTKKAKRYLHTLKAHFKIWLKNGIYHVAAKPEVIEDRAVIGGSDIMNYAEQLIKAKCRREKITYNKKDLFDTAYLLKQYQNYVAGKADMLLEAITETVSTYNIKEKIKQLMPKYIHKTFKKIMKKNGIYLPS